MPLKEPNSRHDYGFDYTSVLDEGETLTASTWTADEGLILSADTFDATSTTVWIEGGSEGEILTATNSVTTSSNPPRKYERVLTFFIETVVDTTEDYRAIAADLVKRWAPAPEPVPNDYYPKAARARRLVLNYLTQTGGGIVSGKSLSGVASKSFSGAAKREMRSIVRDSMGDYYRGAGRSVPIV